MFVDALIAALLTAYAEADVFLRDGVVPGPHAVAALLLAVMTVPLAWRRRAPLAVAVISMSALAAESLAAGGAPEGGAVLLPVLVVLYSVAAHEPLRRAVAGAAVALAAIVIQSIQDPKLAGVGDIVLVDGFFFGIIGCTVWAAGRYTRRRRGVEASLADRTRVLEREQALHAEVVAAERARIARELHDVIAHTVSVMGIQAAAAAEVLDRDPQRARPPLESIQETARGAVDELRRLLTVLRDDSELTGLEPQPGLDALEELIGDQAELQVEGHRRPLPAGVELAAYRIVQEALTNVRKHAAGARARVRVDFAPTQLRIAVEDDGPGVNGSMPRAGHGLVGIRERAAIYGGAAEAGPRAEGGYAVRVQIPLEGGR